MQRMRVFDKIRGRAQAFFEIEVASRTRQSQGSTGSLACFIKPAGSSISRGQLSEGSGILTIN
jgi:hypothetical protein